MPKSVARPRRSPGRDQTVLRQLETDTRIHSEQRLCAAILRRAIADALGQSPDAASAEVQEEALRWIFQSHPWFVTYCHAVGVEPSCLQAWVQRQADAATRERIAKLRTRAFPSEVPALA